MAGVTYKLSPIVPFNIEAGVHAVRAALTKKKGHRHGQEDMGPAGSA
jgi:hypothetical protein